MKMVLKNKEVIYDDGDGGDDGDDDDNGDDDDDDGYWSRLQLF